MRHALRLFCFCTALGLAHQVSAENLRLGLAQGEAVQDVAAGLLTAIYARAGLTASIQPLPAARITFLVLRDELDGEVARIGPYFDRNPSLFKVEPAYYHLITTAFARMDRHIAITSTEDLKNYRVGVIRGVYHAAIATEGVPNVTVTDSVTQLFKMLEANRIDVAVDVRLNGLDVVSQLGLTDIKPVGDLARRDFYNVLIGSKAGLASRIQPVIKAMKASGELARLTAELEKKRLNSGPHRAVEKVQ